MTNETRLTEEKHPIETYNFNQIIEAASKLGISDITITYAGSGDDGGIDQVSLTPEDVDISEVYVDQMYVNYARQSNELENQNVNTEIKKMDLENAVSDFFRNIADSYEINFNDEGCYGSMAFNIETKEIKVENSYPVYHTESYRTKFR